MKSAPTFSAGFDPRYARTRRGARRKFSAGVDPRYAPKELDEDSVRSIIERNLVFSEPLKISNFPSPLEDMDIEVDQKHYTLAADLWRNDGVVNVSILPNPKSMVEPPQSMLESPKLETNIDDVLWLHGVCVARGSWKESGKLHLNFMKSTHPDFIRKLGNYLRRYAGST
jgi:hypothetical protein